MPFTTTQNMFAVYAQAVQRLNYPQYFDSTDDLWDCGIDELPGLIAQTDSEVDVNGFFTECDRISQVIESLGYEI